MLAWKITDDGCLQLGDDGPKFGHAPPALGWVVSRVRQVTGEDDEVRLMGKRVHGGDRLRQRAGRVRIDVLANEAPVGVGQLDEVEVLRRRACRHCLAPRGAQPTGIDDSRHPGDTQKLASVDRHLQYPFAGVGS